MSAHATWDSCYDVAIVGFGPSGAVAAGLLGQQGLRVLVCDKAHAVYEMPRAFALDHEIMRVFQQLGIEQEVLEFAEPFTPSEFYGVNGQLIKRFTTVAPPYPLGYVPSMVFTQPPVERVLRAHVQSLPNVDVALGWALTSLTQDADGVTLELKQEDAREIGSTRDNIHNIGNVRNVRARYVIGCDGATSTVRNAVGINLDDLGFDQPWLVVDVLVNEQGLAKLPPTSVQYCEPQRPCTFLIGPKNHRRWEISINAGEDAKLLATPQGTWGLLSRWITPQDGTLWRQAGYRFHALVADHWRAGRVFVAGDAAHQQPPFLGQGMCQGIRDVANLAWKLGAVWRGEAPEYLLDTYGTERKGHVTELTTRIKAIGQLVGERDLQKARARDAHLLAECGGVVQSVPRQNVQPALQNGLLSSTPHAANGSIFPQPRVVQTGGAVLMDKIAGTGWRLVLRAHSDVVQHLACLPGTLEGMPRVRTLWISESGAESAANEHAVVEADNVAARWFQQHNCVAALVRPDHYVFGVAQTIHEVTALVVDLQTHFKTKETA